MFFGGLFGAYIYAYDSFLLFWIGAEWPPAELFRIKSYRNYL